MGSFRMSLDIVVPTVRANASSLRRVAELSVPPAFAGLRIFIVVDGPQAEEAWLDLRRLEAQHASVELLSTRPGPHGWPAGASTARNAGIEASVADWILFLDDDTTPQPDLLHRYAEAAEACLGCAIGGAFGDLDGDLAGGASQRVYGFAGATVFVAPPASPWAVAARCSGMCDAFTASCRAAHPPWSPTANLMLRRTAPLTLAGSGIPGAASGASAQDVVTAAVEQAEAQGAAEAEAEAESEAEAPSECCKLLPPPQPSPVAAAPRAEPSPRPSNAEQQPQQRKARLPWCHFDETLPANGGAEDVDICLRASVWCEGATHATLPLEMVPRSNGFDSDNANWSAPAATQRLVAVPLAVTTHRLWSARAMLARGLRWGYAGGLIAAKFPALARRRPLNSVESLVLTPTAAALLVLLAAPLLRRPCRPGRAALLCAAVRLADAAYLRAAALPHRIALAGYEPAHARVTLDEPALEACCGRWRCARWAGLVALHMGPLFWLSLCFELGELWAKLTLCTAPSRLLLLEHMWDFSFGSEEPPPPKMVKQLRGAQNARLAVVVLFAVGAEFLLSGVGLIDFSAKRKY